MSRRIKPEVISVLDLYERSRMIWPSNSWFARKTPINSDKPKCCPLDARNSSCSGKLGGIGSSALGGLAGSKVSLDALDSDDDLAGPIKDGNVTGHPAE
jgi:hypothetical protein